MLVLKTIIESSAHSIDPLDSIKRQKATCFTQKWSPVFFFRIGKKWSPLGLFYEILSHLFHLEIGNNMQQFLNEAVSFKCFYSYREI